MPDFKGKSDPRSLAPRRGRENVELRIQVARGPKTGAFGSTWRVGVLLSLTVPAALKESHSQMSRLAQSIRSRLTSDQLRQFKRVYRLGQRVALGALHATDLRRIGESFSAGKYDWYYPAYERHFEPLRKKTRGLLEIGIGGYETAEAGGGSLRMWECYFPHAKVHGIDIYDKSPHDAGRVRTHRGSQADEAFLTSVVEQMGPLDIVIDDGSHVNEHVLKSFQILFPLLDENGLYVIEDTHSSYWESFGGSSKDLKRDDTTMGLVKNLLDSLNHREIRGGSRPSHSFDAWVVEVHCYHNIVFIQKGQNTTVSLSD